MAKSKDQKVVAKTYTSQFTALSPDLVVFQRDHQWESKVVETDAFSSLWSLAVTNFKPGQLAIARKAQVIPISGPSVFVFPPFSLVEWHLASGRLQWDGYLSNQPWPQWAPKQPYVTPTDQLENFKSLKDVTKFLTNPHTKIPIGKEEEVSSVASKLKELIDGSFNESVGIGELVESIGCAHAVACRSFKKGFGISPVSYRNKMRVYDSLRHLIFNQKSVASSGLEAGFSDLSRFNKQFKKQINAVPSQFQLPRLGVSKKNDPGSP